MRLVRCVRPVRSAAVLGAVLPALVLAACSPGGSSAPIPVSGPTTLLVRLGADTLAVEQYTRTATRMDGVLVTHLPAVMVSRYSVTLGAGSAPTSAQFSVRRGDGSMVTGAPQSLSVRLAADSVTYTAHRSGGDTVRTIAARGDLLPYVSSAYGLYELTYARLRATGRDSATFGALPLSFATRATFPMPVRVYGDSARMYYFGSPIRANLDRGRILGMDGRATTAKVVVDRVAAIDPDSLARDWASHERPSGTVGPVSMRDTARSTVGAAHVWVDYGRPSLRGRSVWANGVLGDTIWRTGANAATQLSTDRDIMIGGTPVPAGTYSLWTWATRNGYHLIVNRQAGQWGTEYHAERDLARIPLRETALASPVEQFTVTLPQQAAGNATLVLSWGTKQLSVPLTAK